MAVRNHPIPSLDGLRFLAIALVILEHGFARFRPTAPAGSLSWFVAGRGGDGVQIFFVISGFLITSLLLREHEKYGQVSLRNFYIRRTFRILPPIYVYLLFISGFAAVEHLKVSFGTIASSVLFVRNYSLSPAFWGTEHTWSLAVEEQFYLLWPPLLVLALTRLGSDRGKAAAAKVALFLIAVSPLLRVLQKLYGSKALEHRESYMLHTRMDGLMCGCLLALIIGTPLFERFYAIAAKVWWFYPLYFLALHGYLDTRYGANYRYLFGFTLDSIAISLFLAWAIRNPQRLAGRILNWRPIAFLGVLSYSLYIWQTFFLHGMNPTRASHLPYNLVGLPLAALLSFYLVEQPSLRLRDRLQRPKTDKAGATVAC